jgi:hypothetical protein
MTDIDPLAVPLPRGTEVTVRVDRHVGERVVPRGAMGRVVSCESGSIEVEIVGVGPVTYLREELVPRKQGLVRYAQRRDDAWHALAPCIVIDAVVGSRAWGLASSESDTDRRGVFVLPFAWTIGLVEPPHDIVSEGGSQSYWEIDKTVRQALRADPNTLEMLFAAEHAVDALGCELLEAREAFVSLEIYASFGRYALSQLDRLEHNQRLADHRHLVVEWLRDRPTLDLDTVAERLAVAAHVVAPTEHDAVRRARDYVKQLYRSMYDRGMLTARNWAALVAFARDDAADFELPRDLRPKNAYNLIRLLDLAIHWLVTGEARLRVSDDLRPTLLAIKGGEVPMSDVMRLARAMTPRLERARGASRLPRHPDIARAETIIRRARETAARRHLAADPGPWGRDAPAPPVPHFEASP